MRNSNVPFRRSLLAAAVGTAMLGATVGAQAAETLQFRPGAAIAGVQPNVLIGSIGFTPADLESFVKFQQMNWSARVDLLSDALSPWPIMVNTGGDGSLDAGDAFTESFVFVLSSITDFGPPIDTKDYGAGTAPGISHVFMTADLAGTLKNAVSTNATDLSTLNLNYTKALFTMFFDGDGKLSTAGDQVAIGRFGDDVPLVAPQDGVGDGSTDTGLSTLEWTVNFDAALPGVFADESGNELATGPAFVTGSGNSVAGLSEVTAGLFKITRQAVALATDIGTGGFMLGGAPNMIGIAVRSQSEATGTSEFTVPEPATLGLLGAGLMGFGAAARRRRKARDEG